MNFQRGATENDGKNIDSFFCILSNNQCDPYQIDIITVSMTMATAETRGIISGCIALKKRYRFRHTIEDFDRRRAHCCTTQGSESSNDNLENELPF
jgi:hypothetical protein